MISSREPSVQAIEWMVCFLLFITKYEKSEMTKRMNCQAKDNQSLMIFSKHVLRKTLLIKLRDSELSRSFTMRLIISYPRGESCMFGMKKWWWDAGRLSYNLDFYIPHDRKDVQLDLVLKWRSFWKVVQRGSWPWFRTDHFHQIPVGGIT